jgi:polysaccharide chain length determinant protein (PEP-CTERM system associated)
MDLFANGFSLDLILDILRRRLWVAIVLFSVITTASICLIIPLPNIYTARALIMVEGQQIPSDFVRSTVTMGVERRLQMISQEILSRARLEDLIGQFGLYRELKEQKAPSEMIAAAMRRDIGIAIKGRGSGIGGDTVAFEVSYTNLDPQKAMEVANTLASFYIEENLKVRERQALGTTEFLHNELETVRKRLEEKERKVVQYKQLHLGELPEQLNANISTLGALQKQMEILSQELARARERRNVLVQMAEMDAALASLDFGSSESSGDTQIGSLRSQLAALKTRFSDKHPDVIRLKRHIATLEQQQQESQPESIASELDFSMPEPASMSSTQVEVAAVDAEIQRLTAELSKIRGDLVLYQQRIENTAKHEQELTSITRDYDTTRDLYTSLLKRLDEAKLADSLEQRQKAERFRLLEPATYPRQPEAPSRTRFLLIGLVLSLGAAAGGVLLWEILDTSFHRIEDLKTFAKAPVLISIPRIVTKADRSQSRRWQFLGATALAVSLLVLASVSYKMAEGNESITRMFVSPASGAQLRQ